MGRRARSEYPSLGPNGLAAVGKALRGAVRLPVRPSLDQVFSRYSDLLGRAFAHLSVMVGTKGAQAITQRAIKRASMRLPLLKRAAVSETSLNLDGVRGESATPEQLREASEHLFVTMMDVLASLIGVDLLTTVLARMSSTLDEAGP